MENRKIKICFDMHNLSIHKEIVQKTGIQKVTHSMLKALIKLRQSFKTHQVPIEIICLPTYPIDPSLPLGPTFNCSPALLNKIEKEYSLPSEEIWGFSLKEMKYEVSEEKFYDLCSNADWFCVTSQLNIQHFSSSLKIRNPTIKFSFIFHDLIPSLFPNLVFKDLYLWFKNCYLSSLYSEALLVVGVSRATGIDIINFSSPHFEGAVYHLQLPTDENTKIESQEKIFHSLRLKKEHYFIYIGNADPRKNLINTLKAYKRYVEICRKQNTPFHKLLIVGPRLWRTVELNQAINEANKVGSVVESGYVTDSEMQTLITHAVGLILASRYEGFGIPLGMAKDNNIVALTCNNSSQPESASLDSVFSDPWSNYDMSLGLLELDRNHKIKPHGVRKDFNVETWESYCDNLIQIHLKQG